MLTPVTIQKVTPADAATLLELSRKTFYDAFEQVNNPEDFETYTSEAFTYDRLLAEIENPLSVFFFAMMDGEPIGYLKLNYGDAQTEFKEAHAVEIERIYLLAAHQGKKTGNQLLDFTINKAIAENLQYIWLGVWEHNHAAQRFYSRNGFKPVGSHVFMVGNDEQVDILMRKPLPTLPGREGFKKSPLPGEIIHNL